MATDLCATQQERFVLILVVQHSINTSHAVVKAAVRKQVHTSYSLIPCVIVHVHVSLVIFLMSTETETDSVTKGRLN